MEPTAWSSRGGDSRLGQSGRRGSGAIAAVPGAADADGELQLAIARAKEGSDDAVRYLYCRFADSVTAYVRTIVGDDHDAEDVAHSVFAKLIATRLARYEARSVPFAAWLLRVARNAALDHLRAKRLVPVEEVHVADRPLDTAVELGRITGLREALADLTVEQRRVVLMRHVSGLSPPEIARRLNSSEAAVHGLHHRGRVALRRALASRDIRPAVRSGG